MSRTARGRAVLVLRAAATVLFLFAVAAMLLRFPPERYSFYPPCPIYTLFHIECPGCGATRALAVILRGDLGEALRLNSLFTIALPIVIIWAAFSCLRLVERKRVLSIQPPQNALYVGLAIAAVFTILRNL